MIVAAEQYLPLATYFGCRLQTLEVDLVRLDRVRQRAVVGPDRVVELDADGLRLRLRTTAGDRAGDGVLVGGGHGRSRDTQFHGHDGHGDRDLAQSFSSKRFAGRDAQLIQNLERARVAVRTKRICAGPVRGRTSGAATVARRARPDRHDRGPDVPGGPEVAQRRDAAHGQAARAPGAAGVLGLLRPRVAAHAALPGRVGRALRRGRAAHDPGPGAGLRARSGRGHGRGRRRAPRDHAPGAARPRAEALADLREPGLAVALPVQPGPAAVRGALRRGRLPRDRGGDPGAAGRRRRAGPLRPPRGRPGRADRRADARRRGAVLRALRGRRGRGASWSVARARRRSSSTARSARSSYTGVHTLSSTTTTRRACSTSSVGDGVRCLATLFTPASRPSRAAAAAPAVPRRSRAPRRRASTGSRSRPRR